MYITSYNRTTNEDGKWSDIRKWYKKAQKEYQEAVKKGLVGMNGAKMAPTPNVKDGDVTCTGGGAGMDETGGDQQQQEQEQYFDPGPMPKNVYDRGFVENWKEVLFPLSLRKDVMELGGYSRSTKTSQGEVSSATPTPAPSIISTSFDKTD